MEQHIAIMIADLSGYTALTETHGAVSAADLIDKYIAIAENCLAGDAKLHERTGDEIMVVSKSPEFLLATANNIMQVTSGEENFLQLHGGLHYGKALKRRNSYFGSSINLAARIAGKAEAGNFWCSGEFASALPPAMQEMLHSKGIHSFKNVSEAQELFAIKNHNNNRVYIDSICRMTILDTRKAIRHPAHHDVYFCSGSCRDIYLKNQKTQPLR